MRVWIEVNMLYWPRAIHNCPYIASYLYIPALSLFCLCARRWSSEDPFGRFESSRFELHSRPWDEEEEQDAMEDIHGKVRFSRYIVVWIGICSCMCVYRDRHTKMDRPVACIRVFGLRGRVDLTLQLRLCMLCVQPLWAFPSVLYEVSPPRDQ